MNDFQNKMKEKIKIYSKKEYLDGYINNEFLTNDGDADVFYNIHDKEELFDSRTVHNQIDLLPSVYSFIEDKTSMLDSTIQIQLHIVGVKFHPKEQELIRHLIKEHYAIELYKIQKEYVKYRRKVIVLIFIGIISLLGYAFLSIYSGSLFFLEVFGFLFSFSLWESFDSLIYTMSEIRNRRSDITQNLLLTINFDEDTSIKKEI